MREEIFTDTWLAVVRAWAVHLYTSLGLIMGLLGLIAITEGRVRETAYLMAVAMIIDGTDGLLARRWQVSRWTPRFDGRKLDDITDYLNYAFLPVYFVYRFELLANLWLPVLAVVLVSAAYGFCQSAAKTDDKFFTGFPNYWNLVVLYLFLLGWPPVLNALVLLFLAVMVFVPFKYMSTQNMLMLWPSFTLLFGLFWLLNLWLILIRLPRSNPVLVYASLSFPLYHVGLSLYLNFRPRLAARRTRYLD